MHSVCALTVIAGFLLYKSRSAQMHTFPCMTHWIQGYVSELFQISFSVCGRGRCGRITGDAPLAERRQLHAKQSDTHTHTRAGCLSPPFIQIPSHLSMTSSFPPSIASSCRSLCIKLLFSHRQTASLSRRKRPLPPPFFPRLLIDILADQRSHSSVLMESGIRDRCASALWRRRVSAHHGPAAAAAAVGLKDGGDADAAAMARSANIGTGDGDSRVPAPQDRPEVRDLSDPRELSLEEVLKSYEQPINEEQAWAVCYQCCSRLSKPLSAASFRGPARVKDPSSILLHRDGTVSLRVDPSHGKGPFHRLWIYVRNLSLNISQQ